MFSAVGKYGVSDLVFLGLYDYCNVFLRTPMILQSGFHVHCPCLEHRTYIGFAAYFLGQSDSLFSLMLFWVWFSASECESVSDNVKNRLFIAHR